MKRREPHPALAGIVIAGLLIVFIVTGATAWRDKSPTFDEPLHFAGAWTQTHLDDFRCDPEDPPLWKYYVAALMPADRLRVNDSGLIWDGMLRDRAVEGLFFKQMFYYTPGNDAVGALADARLRMVLLGGILGAGIALWAWRLGGPTAAIVAAAMFCLDPNFLAHASLVKNDVPMTLVFLAFMAALAWVGERITVLNVMALALTTGMALTTKFSGILTIPILIAALAIRALLPQPWRMLRQIAQSRLHRFLGAGMIAVFCGMFSYAFIWACYRFRYAPAPDGHLFDMSELWSISAHHAAFAAYNAFNLSADQLAQWSQHWKPGAILRLAFAIGRHHLLPQAWVEGFIFTVGTAPGRAAFLLGTSSMTGRWDYFPVAMAVKTPLATLIAILLAIVYWIIRRAPRLSVWQWIMLGILPVIYLATAMASDLNLGIRHVLPVYPFLFIFVGITAADALARFPKPAGVILGILMLGLAIETFAAYPDYIPFFNVAAGGWKNGPKILGDSNVDWGQDLPAIARWQREHPQDQLYLGYFGSGDPRYWGIHYVNLPGSMAPEDEAPSPSRPAVYAISGNLPQSPWLPTAAQTLYESLQRRPPLAVLGHCIYLYNPPSG